MGKRFEWFFLKAMDSVEIQFPFSELYKSILDMHKNHLGNVACIEVQQ